MEERDISVLRPQQERLGQRGWRSISRVEKVSKGYCRRPSLLAGRPRL